MEHEPKVNISLLGRLDVSVNQEKVTLQPGKPRLLLASLALASNEPVTIDTLTERLWGDKPPARARGSLHTYVLRLRRSLGHGAILTQPSAYQLAVPPEHVDLWQFRALANQASRLVGLDEQRTTLTQALTLWRGEPLTDCRSEAIDHDVIPGLIEERLTALEQRLALDLALDEPSSYVSELRELVARYPLRESLWSLLMTALSRAGRLAEAIESYHVVRGALKEHLGLDPSPNLQDLYHFLLSDEPATQTEQVANECRIPPASMPQQLPFDSSRFTGRTRELAELDRLAAGPADGHTRIITVVGAGGVGKTALAIHWAHQVRHRFPDGQLHLDLHGWAPAEPVRTTAALDILLHSLGVPTSHLSEELDERSAALRTALAGRQVLLLLDNARDADQVRPLLPGNGCLVLVTSRSQLRGLAIRDGAERLTLRRLAHDDATALLARLADDHGTGADPKDGKKHLSELDELAVLCGHLPLALLVTAERINRYPDVPMDQLTAELRDARHRLDALGGDDQNTDLRAVLSWSYQALDPAVASAFRLLGLYPGNDISLPAAAALTGKPITQIARLLDKLVDVHLLDHPRPDRYEFHDLLRIYAAEQAHRHDSAPLRQVAIRRVLEWYLDLTRHADRRLHPAGRADMLDSTPAIHGHRT